jgi:hypothetical protein
VRLHIYLPWLTALWLAPVTTILVSCASTAHAQAQPGGESERDQQARTRFEQGREAYKDGRYRDAWAYFHEAYQLSGRPELLFNIGQTADRLGQESDALRAFNMYLERLPNAENRRDVENRVRALRERIETTQKAPPSHPAPAAANVAPAQPTPVQPIAAPSRPAARSRRERAEQQQRTAPTPPSAAPAAEHHRELRRGLYLRAALGFGPRTDSVGITGGDFDELDATLSGWGPALDIAAGWAVLPGFVVGGGLFLDWTSSPTFSITDGVDTFERSLSYARLTSIGPFVDWYPKRATLGLHIEGGFGLGLLSYAGDTAAGRQEESASGVTFFLGAGYEWRIAGAFAIGALLRLTGAALANDAETHGLFSPSLLVSFTWF